MGPPEQHTRSVQPVIPCKEQGAGRGGHLGLNKGSESVIGKSDALMAACSSKSLRRPPTSADSLVVSKIQT